MIDEARILEYSGPLLALLRWASMMKQFILYTIFCNVLLLPWGLSHQGHAARRGSDRSSRCSLKFLARGLRRGPRRHNPVPPSLLPLSGAARRVLPAGGPCHHRNAIELTHACRPSRPARRLAVQPAGDREPAARLRHAGLPLAAALSLRLRGAILADRHPVGGGRLLRRLSRSSI